MKFSRYTLKHKVLFSLPGFVSFAYFITDILQMSSCLSIVPLKNKFFVNRFPNTGRLSYVFVEITRFELVTPCLQGRCSPN